MTAVFAILKRLPIAVTLKLAALLVGDASLVKDALAVEAGTLTWLAFAEAHEATIVKVVGLLDAPTLQAIYDAIDPPAKAA